MIILYNKSSSGLVYRAIADITHALSNESGITKKVLTDIDWWFPEIKDKVTLGFKNLLSEYIKAIQKYSEMENVQE